MNWSEVIVPWIAIGAGLALAYFCVTAVQKRVFRSFAATQPALTLGVSIGLISGIGALLYVWLPMSREVIREVPSVEREAPSVEPAPPPMASAKVVARPIADIGPSTPNDIFEYHPRAGAPPYCKDPDLLLGKLKEAIEAKSTSSVAGSCTASVRPQDFSSAKELHVACRLRVEQACSDIYTARLWAERDTETIGEYVLRGFSWIQRSCPKSTYDMPEARLASEGTSDTLKAVFDLCR